MQDAGAARNRRTENGPSGTPAPTGCATGDMARYVWAGCAHWGRSNAVRRSGSGDRSAGDPVRTFLHRSYNRTKGKSKNRRFLAAFFSIFLSLLKEIWPPEAYMQDAGAARNRRTENGPSGTPAPTGCATGDMTRYVWAGCAHWGVQTRDAGAGGVFRQAVIDRCGPSGRRI